MNAKCMKNESAVSPVVATLVLIVVAVVGAVAVGTIMGTFSSDVSKQTNAGDASGASQTEILTAGSTTVYPASLEIAKEYMKNNPGVKITVQPGGSTAGVAATGAGTIDIGASSSLTTINTANSNHPDWDLRYTQIGASGVCLVGGAGTNQISGAIEKSDLMAFINGTDTTLTNATAATKFVQRADGSGTEETFAEWVTSGALKTLDSFSGSSTYEAAQGNSGILNAIKNTPSKVGFLDMGYAFDGDVNVTGVVVANIIDSGVQYTGSKSKMKSAAKDLLGGATSSSNYPIGLVRGLYYVTKGTPNPVVNNFITFAASPGADAAMHTAGVFSNSDVAVV